jgi:4a-hydroxytetrahydrobiopterin dehydratase
MKHLSQAAINSKLKKLSVEWSQVDTRLERVYKFGNYKQAFEFVVKTAKLAESLNHHPEIHFSFDEVVVSLTSHDFDGLTQQDFDFANKLS